MARRGLRLRALVLTTLLSIEGGAAGTPEPGAAVDSVRASRYDAFELSAFVDAYASVNYNFPKPQVGGNAYRAFDTANGFSLSWVGLDASYAPGPVGGTVNLRFGPSAPQLAAGCFGEGQCDADNGLSNVKQAFISLRPGGEAGRLQLDFGKVDTIYGIEGPDSQKNLNYTRGILYGLATPSFHTGLHVTAEVASWQLKGMLVNGWNDTIDNNAGKSLGVQATYRLKGVGDAEPLVASLGYLVGPERDDTAKVTCVPGEAFDPESAMGCADSPGAEGGRFTVDVASANTKGWRHLADLMVTANPAADLQLVFNGDFGVERLRSSSDSNRFAYQYYWGVLLGGRLALGDRFGLAARGEYLSDPDGLATGEPNRDVSLVTGTLTLDFVPAEFLLIRLEQRLDWADEALFQRKIRDTARTQLTTTLGVVASTP